MKVSVETCIQWEIADFPNDGEVPSNLSCWCCCCQSTLCRLQCRPSWWHIDWFSANLTCSLSLCVSSGRRQTSFLCQLRSRRWRYCFCFIALCSKSMSADTLKSHLMPRNTWFADVVATALPPLKAIPKMDDLCVNVLALRNIFLRWSALIDWCASDGPAAVLPLAARTDNANWRFTSKQHQRVRMAVAINFTQKMFSSAVAMHSNDFHEKCLSFCLFLWRPLAWVQLD